MVDRIQEPDSMDAEVVPAPEPDRGAIQSIQRAAMILELFDQHTHALTPVIVAERLGLNRTTAHRYLQSMLAAGFLNSAYGPGPLIDQLSALVSGRQQILSLAPSVMRQLSDRTGLTAVLSFLGRSGAVVSHVEEANAGTIVLTVRVGTPLELQAAQSRVLLAFQTDPTVVQRIHAGLSSNDARSEQTALALARREGAAWADLGRVGLASVAIPVFGTHDIEAAVALIGTAAMLPPSEMSTERVAMLRESAEQLGAIART